MTKKSTETPSFNPLGLVFNGVSFFFFFLMEYLLTTSGSLTLLSAVLLYT